MKKKLVVALSILILASSFCTAYSKSANSTDLTSAIGLYKKGNYSECYTTLQKVLEKDSNNALANYYMAITNVQLGRSYDAVSFYERAISLATPNSNLYRYATKGKLCIESPNKCTDSMYSSAAEEFIRNTNGPKFTEEVKSEFERLKIENFMREMNRSNDVNPSKFRDYRDFSTMNNATPSNDEIVAALRTLQQAGLSNSVNNGYADLSLLTGNNQQAQLLNMLGGNSMNPQVIQSLLTNNMSLGF